MIKEEKFKVIQFIRELILYLDEMLEGFPKKDIEISRNIKQESYDMLKLAYTANVTTDTEYRKRNLEQIIVKIKLLDFFVDLSYNKKIINQKKYSKVSLKLDDIVKYTTGWLKATIKSETDNKI